MIGVSMFGTTKKYTNEKEPAVCGLMISFKCSTSTRARKLTGCFRRADLFDG